MYILPQNEVICTLPQNEVNKTVQPQNEVIMSILPQNGVYKTILHQNEMLKSVTANWQLSYNLTIIHVKTFRFCALILSHGVEYIIRISMESFHHISKMYAWSLSENQTFVKFRCKLIGLFVKQSFCSKHDFAVCVYELYLASSWHLRKFISDKQPNFNVQIRENQSSRLTEFEFYGGGQALIFSMDELLPYALTDLSVPQYKFIQCVKICHKQSPVLADDEILCKIPLNALAPKLTIKYAKKISMLHDIFMPSKIQLKNAQTLLKRHKCQCGDFVSIFKPHVVVPNSNRQKTWYQNHKEQRAEYNMQPEYQASHRKSAHKSYWAKKDVEFPPDPPSTDLCQKIVSDFCADTSPDVFEVAGCAVCGK